jgi:hypothetical protein
MSVKLGSLTRKKHVTLRCLRQNTEVCEPQGEEATEERRKLRSEWPQNL